MGLKAAVQRGAVQLELGFIELQPEPAVCQLALSLCIGHQSRSIQIPGAMGRRPKVPLIIPAAVASVSDIVLLKRAAGQA